MVFKIYKTDLQIFNVQQIICATFTHEPAEMNLC